MADNTSIHETAPDRKGRKPTARKIGWIIALTVAGSIVLLLAAAAFGGYLYLESRYNHAVFLTEQRQYGQAAETLAGLPEFYKDSPQFMKYAEACASLEKGDLQAARNGFTELGGYRDSAGQLKEVSYREAANLLEAGELETARQAFTAFAAEDFKDAKTMLLEIDYRKASQLFDAKDWMAAYEAFDALKDYKDSPDRLKSAGHCILLQAKIDYSRADYNAATELLQRIAGSDEFSKDVQNYLTLIDAHGKGNLKCYQDYDGMKALYDKLKSMGTLEDATALRTSDAFLLLWLEGTWRDRNGRLNMEIRYDRAKKMWYISKVPLDMASAKLERSCVYRWTDGSWDLSVRFVPDPEDRLTVEFIFNGLVYDSLAADRS